MAILKFMYNNYLNRFGLKPMDKPIFTDKRDRLPQTTAKPPLLPKPKIILPSKRLIKKDISSENVTSSQKPSTKISSGTTSSDNLTAATIISDVSAAVTTISEVSKAVTTSSEIFIGAATVSEVSTTATISSEVSTAITTSSGVFTSVATSSEVSTSVTCNEIKASHNDCSNFEENFESIVSSLEHQSFLSSNESELSTLDSLDGDKESDSDLTDSASQQSIEATLNTKIDTSSEAFLIANELAYTEKTYIDVLHLIVYKLKEFLEDYSRKIGINKVIPDYELDKIISSLPQLLSLNEDLYVDLKNRIDHWSEHPKIADVIIKKGPFLKLYTTYFKEFETVCSYIDDCRTKYPKFSDALNEFESLPICKNLNLKHYMLKPIQRIPQYRLLLQNYLKHVNPESSEHIDATKALQIIQEVLSHTNNTLNLDNTSKLLQIQSRLASHEIIKPGRRFLREGDLFKLSRKEMQLRFFILLSDCLLYTTYVTLSTLKVKYELPLLGMKVQTNCTEIYEFSIITSTRSFTLRARDSNEYYEWVRSLHTAIDENNKRQLTFARPVELNYGRLKLGQEAPVWIQDKRTTMCQVCTAEFTMTFRRHHCRSCGKVVCSKCSNNKAPLAYLKFHSARVCELCYDHLYKELTHPENKLLEIVKADLEMSEREAIRFLNTLVSSFKRYPYQEKTKRYIPQRLKEVAGDELGDITSSGWLLRRGRRGWKRLWFVLKGSVLYEYKASHDVVAHRSLPVLGYSITRAPSSLHEECNNNLAFSLNHPGQSSLIFMALSEDSCEMWISVLTEATILK